MIRASEAADEIARLGVLRSLALLDTLPETGFDLIAEAAASAAGTEIALISLVDADRQWFKAKVGLDASETPRDVAFCAHAILGDDVFWVEDAARDERFCDNPLVTGGPHIRSYAGAPIRVSGAAVGTVCAIDGNPRVYDPKVAAHLKLLAAIIADRLQMRRRMLLTSRLLEGTSDAVVGADSEQRITQWNAAAERLFGYTAEEAIGRPLSLLVPERLRNAHDAGFRRVRDGGAIRVASRTITVPGLKRDGAEFPIELSLSLSRDAGLFSVAAIIRDCSEREALLQARAANEAKDRFLANMSHEIRTPLNGVLGLAQVLQRTPLETRQREAVNAIHASAVTLDRVLSDVLDSARIEAGELRIVHDAFDLATLLSDLVMLHCPTAQAKGVECRAPHLPGPVWVEGDAARLSQILGNLLGNAVKFTSTGSVSLSAQQDQGQWTFDVADTGPGIDAELRARLFRPFQQGDASSTRRHGGTGLGLAIARGLADSLGGELTELEAPVGALFRLRVPLAAAAAPEAEGGGEQPQRSLRLLAAEDHPINRKVLAMLLEPLPVTLTMVEDGAEALEAFEAQPFDAVLMDMHMPILDGLAATREIRRREAASGRRRTPVLMLTANALPEHVAASLEAGADRHLAKPIRVDILFAALAELCADESELTASAAA